MRRTASQPSLKYIRENDFEEGQNVRIKGIGLGDVDSVSKQVSCMTIHKKPRVELFSGEKYEAWRQEQRDGAARLKKQLKAKLAIQKLIDEQISRFQSHYIRSIRPTKLTDVIQLLMPKWSPAHELATLSWLGDWRPSTILELVHLQINFLSNPVGVERALAQLINDVQIEEAVIDEEMTEIQATCVLHLPFGPVEGNGTALTQVKSEFKKIYRVISKAQSLRLKTLELVVRKILSQTDAAEFIVAFAALQDMVHRVATDFNARKGSVTVQIL